MFKTARTGRLGRGRRTPGGILRCCVAVYLVLQVVCTPIHLHMEPHSDLADLQWNRTSSPENLAIACDGHASHSGHERHSASQHDLQVLRTPRVVVAEMAPAHFTECLPKEESLTQGQVLVFSGLSPPELPRSWQFVLRAALPVRAPSVIS